MTHSTLEVPGLIRRNTRTTVDERTLFATRLTRIRCRRGLSIRALSEKAGVGLSSLYALEKAERFPTKRIVAKLATALCITPITLFRPDQRVKEDRELGLRLGAIA